MSDRSIRRTICAAAIASFACAAASAADVVRYGGDRSFPPFESLDAQGRPQGFQIDLLNELAAVGGFEPVIRLGDWPVIEADFRAGRIDLVAMVDTRERREWAAFLRSHATPAFGLYHAGNEPAPLSLQALQGRRIAVLDSAAMKETREQLLAAGADWLPTADAQTALAAVAEGRADLALLPRAYADPLLASAALAGVRASSFSPRLQAYALAVAPGNSALKARIEAALAQLQANGRLDALRQRWLSSDHDASAQAALQSTTARQRTTIGVVAAGSVGAIALLGFALRRRGLLVAAERRRRLEIEAALGRARQKLERSFTLHPEAMLITERGGGTVRDANVALCRLVGMPASELLGQPLQKLADVIDSATLQRLQATLADMGALDGAPLPLRRRDGQQRDCLVTSEIMEVDGVAHVFTIVRDVTDRLQQDAAMRRAYDAVTASLANTQEALAQAREKERQGESAMGAALGAGAHGLKMPVRAVRAATGLLRDQLQAGHLQQAVATTAQIDRAAQRMDRMIDALAQLARLGSVPLQREPLEMDVLARSVWDMVALANGATRIAIDVKRLPPAEADRMQVTQVWQIVLDNACRFTRQVDAPQVQVDAFEEGGRTWYRVRDNGVGFDMARAQRLFKPFARLHPPAPDAGPGMGLNIAIGIVERHGGAIHAHSQVGVGTVLAFTLAPAPAP